MPSLQSSGGINLWCSFIPSLPSGIISGVSYEIKTTSYNAMTDAYVDIRLSSPCLWRCPLALTKTDPAALRRPLLTAAWCFSGLGHCLFGPLSPSGPTVQGSGGQYTLYQAGPLPSWCLFQLGSFWLHLTENSALFNSPNKHCSVHTGILEWFPYSGQQAV